MKKTLTFITIMFVIILLAACSTDQEAPPAAPRMYIALGDSVSAGYGIHSPACRHSGVFFEMLYYGGYADEYVNMAVDGFTTTALLELLHNLDEYELELFENAVVITLNIGGNNILRPFLDHLPAANEIGLVLSDAMDLTREARETLSEIMDFVSESRDTLAEISDFATDFMNVINNFQIADVLRLREFIDRASVIDDALMLIEAINDLEAEVSDIFERTSELELMSIFSLLSGSFPPELEAQLEEGIRIFADEFAEIIEWLGNNAPEAVIIANTVYNPIPESILGLHINISDQAHAMIGEINQIIFEQSADGSFIVSDIYSVLTNEVGLMNFSLDIIHPNPAGQNLIAQMNFEDFLLHVGRK